MKITTAWARERVGEGPWLISAYCETTEDAHGGEPNFFARDIAQWTDTSEVRVIVLDVPMSAILAEFDRKPPTVAATVTPKEEDQ